MRVEEIKEIREKVRCPQLDGTPEYGEWGALRLEQRRAIAQMCEELIYYKEVLDNDALHSMHHRILNNFGIDEQLKHFYTEVCELTKALYDEDETTGDAIGELADCYNFLDQFSLYLGADKVTLSAIQFRKSKRTIDEMNGEKVR